jgi:anti-sigma factor RsiW
MDEKFSEDLLSAYFDGELSPAARAQVESHLQGDLAARRQLGEIRRLSGLMQDLQGVPAPAEFCAAVMQSIEREMLLGPPAPPATSVTGSRRAARWLYGSSAFATAALLLIAVAYYSRTPQGGDIAERTAPVAARHEGASPLEVVRRDAAAASKTGIEMARTASPTWLIRRQCGRSRLRTSSI